MNPTPLADAPPATVQPGAFLTLHYRLSGPGGDLINTFGGKPATLSLGTGELSAALEDRLLGLAEGAHARFDLPAGDAFGPRDAQRVQWVARSLLERLGDPHESYTPGDVVQFPTPDGAGRYAGSVVQVGEGGAVQFDFNHPLAGEPVRFEVLLLGVL